MRELDALVSAGRIPSNNEVLYWLLRWTGCHASEGAGIGFKDMDLD